MAYTDFKVGIGVDFLTSNSELQTQLNKYAKGLKVDATVGVDYTKAQVDAKEAANKIQQILQQAYKDATGKDLSNNDAKRFTTKYLKEYINTVNQASASTTKFATDLQRITVSNSIQTWCTGNTKALKKNKAAIAEMLEKLSSVDDMTMDDFNNLKIQFKQIQQQARVTGNLGLTMGGKLSKAFSKITGWTIAMKTFQMLSQATKKAVNEIYELDTALVDLKKTTDASTKELEEFYFSANDTAKELGVTTKEVINATSAWSRLGYSIKDAQTMAKNSSILSSISPEMDIDTATDGLVSVLKAFEIDAEDSLDGVISKINIIGNTQAVDNNDIVDVLTRSSSAMKEANNTLEETIALGVAATEITRDADAVGTALKTISMRIRGYDEETESYSEDLENLSGTIADLTKTASSPGGISLFTDSSKTEYKSTYQILKDISEIYDDLTDKNQAQLLEALAGKRQGQMVAAILGNFENAEKSMDSMANSAGNAMEEMEIIYDSMGYKLNTLKETGVGIAQDIFDSDVLKGGLDLINALAKGVEFLTDKIGVLSPMIGGLTAYGLGKKGLD